MHSKGLFALALAVLLGAGWSVWRAPRAEADGITWIEDYQQGLAEAREQGKPILLVFR